MLKEYNHSLLVYDLEATTQLMRSACDKELKKISDLSSLQLIFLKTASSSEIVLRDIMMEKTGIYGDGFD